MGQYQWVDVYYSGHLARHSLQLISSIIRPVKYCYNSWPEANTMKRSGKPKNVTDRRYRPLGLTIALLATVGLYGLWPMLPTLLLLWVDARGHQNVGGEIINTLGWVNTAFGFITVVACVMAWVGRPRWSRWLVIALVLVATVFRLVQTVQSLTTSSCGIGQVCGSLQALERPYGLCQGLMLILVPLYIVWYMNRAPARAFYR